MARGEAREGSDVDLLVAFAPGARVGLLELAALQEELQGALGVPVDLLELEGLKPWFREKILKESLEAA
ncbi:nucleotidyltransferase domain-containing protein [Thermus sp.]|uniref:nucleotidyltransferase family protein n=1 Tax=Thermus sp. TaxID=275 RepID=UPI00307F11C5